MARPPWAMSTVVGRGPAGPQGNDGPQGLRGLPGTNGVATDEAVATNIGDDATETAAALKAWERTRGAKFFAGDYGLSVSGTPSGNTTALRNALLDAHASWLAGFGGTVLLPAGFYEYDENPGIPSFTTAGNSWDEDNPIRILGAGENLTILHYTGSGGHALAHDSINGVTNRGQNYGVEIAYFTLIGPQNFVNPAHGIGIDNTRKVDIHHLAIRGFPGGVGIHLRSHGTGGIFGGQVYRCRFGQAVNLSAGSYGGYKLNSPSDLEQWAMRYGVWLDGPYVGNGKVNDIEISSNQFYDMLIGCVDTEGHGPWTTTGGTVNSGTLGTVTSTTLMALGAGASSLDNYYAGCSLSITSGAASGQAKTIQTYDGATKTATLSSGFTVAPTPGDGYAVTTKASKGSSANLKSQSNDYFMAGPRKLEEAVKPNVLSDADYLIGTPTSTVQQLAYRDDADAGQDDDLIGYALAIEHPLGSGTWESQIISDYVASTRVVTTAAFSFTPLNGEKYRLLPPGGLSAVTSTTVMRLRQGQVGGALEGTTFLNADHDLDGYYLALRDADNKWHRRYITNFVGSTREVTVGTAFGFTPVVGNDYRIGYADADARAKWSNPIALQHAFRWASQYTARSESDYFEESRWLVAHANANSNFTFVNPDDVVNDTSYGIRDDYTKWFPRLVVADRPRGSDAIPASVMTTDILVHHPELDNGEFGILGRLTNKTGVRLYTGDVVRIKSNGQQADVSQTWGSITVPHVVVASPWRKYFDPDEEFTYAISGVWKVSVSATTAFGDTLIPTTGQRATPAATLDLTTFDTTAEIDTDAELVTVLQAMGTRIKAERWRLCVSIGSVTGSGKVRALFGAR